MLSYHKFHAWNEKEKLHRTINRVDCPIVFSTRQQAMNTRVLSSMRVEIFSASYSEKLRVFTCHLYSCLTLYVRGSELEYYRRRNTSLNRASHHCNGKNITFVAMITSFWQWVFCYRVALVTLKTCRYFDLGTNHLITWLINEKHFWSI